MGFVSCCRFDWHSGRNSGSLASCPVVEVYFVFFFFLMVSGHFNFDSWVSESQVCLEFISPVHIPGHFLRAFVVNRIPALVNGGAHEHQR